MNTAGNRTLTVSLFAIAGPLIGAGSLLLWAVADGAATGGFSWSSVPSAIPLLAVMGFIFGIGPALFAGVIYALLPGAAQRVVLSPLYGAGATWLFFAIVGLFNPSLATFGQSSMMWVTGGVAAFGCALIGRHLGWTPKHGGETHGGTENTAD